MIKKIINSKNNNIDLKFISTLHSMQLNSFIHYFKYRKNNPVDQQATFKTQWLIYVQCIAGVFEHKCVTHGGCRVYQQLMSLALRALCEIPEADVRTFREEVE